MNTKAVQAVPPTDTDRELDRALASGPLRDIVIPPCPELLIALRREMDKEDPDPQVVAAIAGRDVAMSASLIRTANSPYYARSRPVTSVAEALGLLGLRMTEKLLTAFLTRNSIRVSSPVLEHFWDTSTRRALAMAHIARQLYGVEPDLAYTCGLFCHVGIPILMQGVRGYAGTLTEALARQDRSFTETENAAHKTDHAVVGALVARTWRLPTPIYQAVRVHHDFTVLRDTSVAPEVRMLVSMGLVAEHLVALHEGADELREWSLHGADCLACLAINETEVDSWVDALHPIFEGVALG
ncbi:MAG: HDOD domain-containing protein [Pseudomonadota bacterium]